MTDNESTVAWMLAAAARRAVLMSESAAELADQLDTVGPPHNTASLSMLEEATIAFASRSPEVRQPHAEFAEARHVYLDSYSDGDYSDEAWQAATGAAHRLAEALRPLNGLRIARCGKQTEWGVCRLPLDEAGRCPDEGEHLRGSV